MRFFILLLMVCHLTGVAQVKDTRPTIAVPMFRSDNAKHEKYLAPITQKVTEMLRSSKRFVVVSRTDEDVKAERNFQKSEEFLDRQMGAQNAEQISDIVDQDADYKQIKMVELENGEVVFQGAQYILQGEMRKLDIVKILNADNSTAGYKALISIQLSVNTTATNTLSEAAGFESVPLKVAMFSPDRAVDDAILTFEPSLLAYFVTAFPLQCSIAKVMDGGVIISAGSSQGAKVGDRFAVSCVEDLMGEPVEVSLGEVKVTKIVAENFAECAIIKGKNEIVERFNKAMDVKCTIINKSKK